MNTLLQKLLLLPVSIFPLLFLAGCWSSVELNDRSFARLMLIDKTKDGIELSLGFPLPNRLIPGQSGGTGEQSGKPYTFVTQKGRDIGEAYRNIQSDLSRTITFGQTSVVVIGSEMAKEGIVPVLEFMAREPRFHINANVYITPGKAQELTSVPIIFERFPIDILVAYAKEHVTLDTTTKDCLIATYHGGDMIIPLLNFETKAFPSEKQRLQKWLGTDGAAILRQGKLVSTLNTYEMRGAMWVMGQMENAEISVKSTTDGKHVDYMVNQTHTKITPVTSGDQISFQIKVKADASLISSDSDVNLLDLQQQRKLEQGIAALVEQRMAKAVEKARLVNADVFRLGESLDWNDPGRWKQLAPSWRQLYRDKISIAYAADITIKRLGTVKEPTRIRTSFRPEVTE